MRSRFLNPSQWSQHQTFLLYESQKKGGSEKKEKKKKSKVGLEIGIRQEKRQQGKANFSAK